MAKNKEGIEQPNMVNSSKYREEHDRIFAKKNNKNKLTKDKKEEKISL